MESSKLDVFIRDRVPEVLRLHKLFHSRVYELVSALLEMKSRFENQGARNDLHELKVTGWHDYLESIGVNPSTFRTWKHRTETKQLVAIVDPPAPATNLKGSVGTLRKTGPNPVQATAAQAAAKSLADAKRQLGAAAAAGNAQAAAIIAEYEKAVTTADSSTLTNEDNSTSDSGVVINPTESESAGVRLAEEVFLFAAPPVAEHEKVAASPDKLGPSVSTLNAEPDWKQVLVELLQVLEQSGDRLPLVVLKEKRKIDSLLAGKGYGRSEGAAYSTPTKRYNNVMKLDVEGNRRWSVITEGEKNAWGIFETESEADEAIANLNSPIVSLSDLGDGSKKLPVSVTLDCAGSSSMDGGTV